MCDVLIVAVGRDCFQFLPGCLASIAEQTYRPLRVVLVDDASSDPMQRQLVAEVGGWADWRAILNDRPVGALANIDRAIRSTAGDPDEVVILVDADDALDGARSVDTIMAAFADPDVWLTFGSYRPDPPDGRAPLAAPYPDDVIEQRTFRYQEAARFNHPLAFRRFLFDAIPPGELRTPTGAWVPFVYDEALMYPMLEMAGARHRFLSDVTYRYTTANPASCTADPERAEASRLAAAELRSRKRLPLLDRASPVD
jgi:glycosyltransferase involved in cell wall biosynthesis